jgi:hypothetical protein
MWTSPTGHKYLTHPDSRLLFPALCLPTGEIRTAPNTYRPTGNRTAMMPKRWRTREQDRAHRIDTERALNQQARQADHPPHPVPHPRPAPPTDTHEEPPPF